MISIIIFHIFGEIISLFFFQNGESPEEPDAAPLDRRKEPQKEEKKEAAEKESEDSDDEDDDESEEEEETKPQTGNHHKTMDNDNKMCWLLIVLLQIKKKNSMDSQIIVPLVGKMGKVSFPIYHLSLQNITIGIWVWSVQFSIQ